MQRNLKLQVTIPGFGTAGFEAAGLAAEGAGLVDDGAGLVGAEEAAFVTAGLGAGLEAVVAPVNGFLAAEGPPVAGRLEVQLWSLTQFYSIDFSQSRIGVKKCVFYKCTIKVRVTCC